jgi:hypothetical protein
MLAQKSYPTEHVEHCRRWFGERIAGYEALGLTPEQAAAYAPGHAQLLVLGLDHLFTHRMRGQEGTGTLSEVRGLCDAIRAGTAPALTVADVGRLAESFLAEIEARFPAAVTS